MEREVYVRDTEDPEAVLPVEQRSMDMPDVKMVKGVEMN